MNICTERLTMAHLPLLEQWNGRSEGIITPNDLPSDKEKLGCWISESMANPQRLDCLILTYETPVGLAGLLRYGDVTAQLYLLLGEVGYNLLRTGTFAILRMLDRAFLDLGYSQAIMQIYAHHDWLLAPLEQMGFASTSSKDGILFYVIDKATFLGRKYLF